jgi:hypothetical protein
MRIAVRICPSAPRARGRRPNASTSAQHYAVGSTRARAYWSPGKCPSRWTFPATRRARVLVGKRVVPWQGRTPADRTLRRASGSQHRGRARGLRGVVSYRCPARVPFRSIRVERDRLDISQVTDLASLSYGGPPGGRTRHQRIMSLGARTIQRNRDTTEQVAMRLPGEVPALSFARLSPFVLPRCPTSVPRVFTGVARACRPTMLAPHRLAEARTAP